MSDRGDPAVRWRRLERQVMARILGCGELSPAARLVLAAVVRRLGGGDGFPSRKDLGRQLGLGRAALRAAIDELVCTGLVRTEDRGSRPDKWELDVERVELWAAGRAGLWADFRPTSGPKIGPQSVEDRPTNRPAPSLVEPAAATRAAAPTREASDLDRAERDAVRALQDAGWGAVSRATRATLREWLRAGAPAGDLAYAARECDRAGIRTLRYLETILERRRDEAAATAARPIDLETYRGRGA